MLMFSRKINFSHTAFVAICISFGGISITTHMVYRSLEGSDRVKRKKEKTITITPKALQEKNHASKPVDGLSIKF